MMTLPTREQVDAAPSLDFSQTRGEKQCNIQVELAPDGLHVRAEYRGCINKLLHFMAITAQTKRRLGVECKRMVRQAY